MLRKILKLEFALFVVLAAMNLAFWHSFPDINPPQTPAPAGMKYEPYCAGGVSDRLIKINENYCLADYPGELSKVTASVLSLILLVLFPILLLAIEFRKKHVANKEKH